MGRSGGRSGVLRSADYFDQSHFIREFRSCSARLQGATAAVTREMMRAAP
jgi:hypothetical protein